MKKLTTLLTALLLVSLPICARGLTGGAKVGLNISSFTGKDAKPAGGSIIQRSGLIAGGYVIFPVKDQFSFQPEFLISVKGATYKYVILDVPAVGDMSFEEILTLTYIELPLLARYDVISRGAAKPNILFGPSFGIKMSARAETRSLGVNESSSITGIKPIDPGLVLGGGIDINTGTGKITFELRYTMGLATIVEHAQGNENIRNSAGSLMLGYQF
jgi:hypothetical protein